MYKVSPRRPAATDCAPEGGQCASQFRLEFDVSLVMQRLLEDNTLQRAAPRLSGTAPSSFLLSERVCLFAMDRVRPLAGVGYLLELLPGDTSLDRSGGERRVRPAMSACGGSWLQLGKEKCKALLSDDRLLPGGWSYEHYCAALASLCAACNFAGVLLADVRQPRPD